MATVPVQDTFAVSEVVTAAKLNKNVRDSVTFLKRPPCASVVASVAGSVPTGSAGYRPSFGTVVDDSDGMFNVSNPTRLTVNTAGLYRVSAAFAFALNATGSRGFQFVINNATRIRGAASGSNAAYYAELNNTFTYRFNVGDYVEIEATQNSGAALANVVADSATRLDMHWLAA